MATLPRRQVNDGACQDGFPRFAYCVRSTSPAADAREKWAPSIMRLVTQLHTQPRPRKRITNVCYKRINETMSFRAPPEASPGRRITQQRDTFADEVFAVY